MKMSRTLWIILGIAVLAVLWIFSSYNGLVSSHAQVEGSWAQVQTQYQRRFDLIPNLQATVKGAANFEKTTLLEVTEARTKWLDASASRGDKIAAAQQFDSAISRLLVTVEAYPQLQATQAFRDFMTQLEGTENRISVARKDFNDAVQQYNVKIRTFPTMIVARLFGFTEEKFFESTAGSQNAPAVSF